MEPKSVLTGFEQDGYGLSDLFFQESSCGFAGYFDHPPAPFFLNGIWKLAIHDGSPRTLTDGVGENVRFGKPDGTHKRKGLLEFLFSFAGEAYHDIGCNSTTGKAFPKPVHNPAVFRRIIMAVHPP